MNFRFFLCRWGWKTVCLASAVVLVAWQVAHPAGIEPLAENRVLHSQTFRGQTYKLADDGRIYRVDPASGRWLLESTVFDPKIVSNSYVSEGGKMYRVDLDTGRKFPTTKHFQEDFEELPTGEEGLRHLLTEARGWTEVTLQTPLTPTVQDYVTLRNEIRAGRRGFQDAKVSPFLERPHNGKTSLKCVCPPRSEGMDCSKASLTSGIIYFVRGDDFWYQGWYWIDGPGVPFTLIDLESDLLVDSPGIRVMIFDGAYLGAELKALDKPAFRQPKEKQSPLPLRQWVKITCHFHLDTGSKGRVQLWQNEKLVVDERGPTLIYAKAIYNSLEVGVSAHTFGNQATTVYLDDVIATTKPLMPE